MNWWTVNYEVAWDAAVGHEHANLWPSELCLFLPPPPLVRVSLPRSRCVEMTPTRMRFISLSLSFFPSPSWTLIMSIVTLSSAILTRPLVVIIIGYLTAPVLEPVVAAVFVELLARWRSLLFFRRLICISSKCLQATKWGGRSWRSLKHLADTPSLITPTPSLLDNLSSWLFFILPCFRSSLCQPFSPTLLSRHILRNHPGVTILLPPKTQGGQTLF